MQDPAIVLNTGLIEITLISRPVEPRHRLGTLARAMVTAPGSARAPETWATGFQKTLTDLSVDRANHNIVVQEMSSAFSNSSAVALTNSGGRHPSRAVRPCPTGIARPHFLALSDRLRYWGRLVGLLFRARGAVLRGGRQSWQNHRQRGVGSRFLRKVCRSSPGDRVIERRRMLAPMRGIKQEEITRQPQPSSPRPARLRDQLGRQKALVRDDLPCDCVPSESCAHGVSASPQTDG